MAFISERKNREGNVYVYLVESYREKDKVKSRILKSYGKKDELERSEPGIVRRLKEEAKAGTLSNDDLSLTLAIDLKKKITRDDVNYGYLLLRDIYNELGVERVLNKKKSQQTCDVNKLMELLVYSRLLVPASKKKTIENQKYFLEDWHFTTNDVYRQLSYFTTLSEEIQSAMHEAVVKHIGRVATLVFYDVTNYYFETDIDDIDNVDENGEIINKGIRRRGASKEHRPKPIVQMGLFMDTNGIPISYKLFPGNNTDPTTYIPAIEQVKKQFGIERVVVVADKAMNSKKNVTKTYHNSDGWLFSQKHRGKRGADKKIQAFVLDENDWEYNKSQTFAKKSIIRERKLDEGIIVQEKIVVTWREKYANREKIRREGAIAFAQGLRNPERYRASCKRGGKKYLELMVEDKETGELKKLSPFLDIDQEAIDFDAQFDGINVLVTSEIGMSDEDIIKHYSELSAIEDCFRVTKTELNARPVYVRLPEHIDAHFLICFIALVLLRVLQVKTGRMMSARCYIDALESGLANQLDKGYWRVQGNDDLLALNKAIGIDWESAYVKHERLLAYAKGWFTTPKN